MIDQSVAHFKIRMPSELKEWIAATARANHRSVTAEINHRLEEARRSADAKEAVA